MLLTAHATTMFSFRLDVFVALLLTFGFCQIWLYDLPVVRDAAGRHFIGSDLAATKCEPPMTSADCGLD